MEETEVATGDRWFQRFSFRDVFSQVSERTSPDCSVQLETLFIFPLFSLFYCSLFRFILSYEILLNQPK